MEILPEEPAASPNSNGDPEASSAVYEETWVQCDSPTCQKWRLVPKVDLEKAWFCSMNPDPAYSSCSVPQARFPSESTLRNQGLHFVHSVLPVGSLVLARVCKWPWWPAVLSPEPESGDYVSLNSDGEVESYHVEFLGTPHSRYWVSGRQLTNYRPITSKEHSAARGVILRRSFKFAAQEANRISGMGCEDRLRTCHFRPHIGGRRFNWPSVMKRWDPNPNQQETPQQAGYVDLPSPYDRDVLTVEGFRFESAVCRDELRRLGSPHGRGGHSGTK